MSINQYRRTDWHHTCPECHGDFEGLKVTVYCSPKCKGRANRAQQKPSNLIPIPEKFVSVD